MSLTVDGVWKAGVWAPTVWADGVWSEGGTPPVPPTADVRGTPTAPLREKRGEPWVWNPPSETEEERAERIRLAHIRLGIVEAPVAKVSAAQVPSKVTRGTRIAAADSRVARLVEPAPSVEDAALAGPASAERELSAAELEELGQLVRLEMRRRQNAALAAILLSAVN